jgi:apolipoprotein N-acyltransferase
MQTTLKPEYAGGAAAAPLPAPSNQLDAYSWLWLICAAVLLLVADGRNTASLAMWAAVAMLLRFVRTQPMGRGLAVVYLLRLAIVPIALRGMIPIPVPYYYIFLVISGISGIIPYLLDRWLAPRLPGIANTLIFPLSLTLMQWIYGHGPMGSWGSIAYSQTGNLALEQLLSVTGLPGIVFLVGWFASSVNWAWQGRDLRRLTAFAAVIGAVLLLGELRLVLAPPAAPTVRVASLSANRSLSQTSDALAHMVQFGQSSAAEMESFRESTDIVNEDLLVRTEREARAGAKLLLWAEGSAQLLKQDEPQYIARGQSLARQYGVYLAMSLNTWTPGAPKPLENKVALIAPDGTLAWQYWKARPTPGPETAASVPTDGRLKTLDTPYGRVTTPICYDMDFPSLLAQAGKARVDLTLSGANDWRAVDPRHTEISSYRAIEQGFNLVRQSSGGLSAAYDYEGRVLAAADTYHAGDGTLVAQVPTRGVRTIYSVLGDWFVWISAAGLAALIAMALRKRPAGSVA